MHVGIMSIVEFRHSCLGIVERIPQKNRIFCLQHVFHDCHEAYKDVSGSEPMYHVELVISSRKEMFSSIYYRIIFVMEVTIKIMEL